MKPLFVIPAQAVIQKLFISPECLKGNLRFSWIPDHRRTAAVRNDERFGVGP